ncbi:MAG: DUF3108 domain-containing protein [Candidatus Omnitrophica bacterium]|nr:DUF3108 domain-containing protein [Candidatus Omnitrophota bacterium]
MKKIIISILLLAVFLVFWARYNNDPGNILSNLLKRGDLRQGELVYGISLFGFIPLGEAIFKEAKEEELNGRKVYHLSASAKSLKIIAPFLSGTVNLDSYIDRESLNPLVFKQEIFVRGKNDLIREASYDQAQGVMTLAGVRRQVLPNTQDHLSAIYNLRRMDFDKLKDYDININTNQKNYSLKGKSQAGQIALKGKIYKTTFLEASISRRDKNPYHKSTMSMLLLKDEGNLPIMIKAFASGAVINVKLIETR